MPRRPEVRMKEGLAAQGVLRLRPEPLLQRQLVVLLCALAALWWLVVAQAQSAVYYADDIQQSPASTRVSPGYLTVIEFYQDIDQISSGRPDLLHVEAVGAKIYVSALARTGSTDLVIEVGARTQLLHIQIAPGNNTRRYVVLLDKPPPPPAKPVAPKPAPPIKPASPVKPAPPVKPTPVSAAPVKAVLVKSALTKSAPAKPVAAVPSPIPPAPVTLVPTQPAPATPAQPPKSVAPPAQTAPQDAASTKDWRSAPQPSWLSFRVIERDLGHSDSEVTLFFALENSGTAPLLVIDAADLHATQNGAAVPVRLRQGLNPATLRADRTHQGTLVLQLSAAMRRAGPITLSWTLRDPGKQLAYTVVKQVNPLGLN